MTKKYDYRFEIDIETDELREAETYICPACGEEMYYEWDTLYCPNNSGCGLSIPYDDYFSDDPLKSWRMEYVCPICGEPLLMDGPKLRCSNFNCSFQCRLTAYGFDDMFDESIMIDGVYFGHYTPGPDDC